jgi:hypothetical protein
MTSNKERNPKDNANERIEKILSHINNKMDLIEMNKTKNNYVDYTKKIIKAASLFRKFEKKQFSKNDIFSIINLLSSIFSSSKREEFILIQTLIETVPLLIRLIRNFNVIIKRRQLLVNFYQYFNFNKKRKNFNMVEILISISIIGIKLKFNFKSCFFRYIFKKIFIIKD